MLDVRGLTWDPTNVAHIARHGITADDVVAVCEGSHIVREGYTQRLMLIGPVGNDRMVAVILDPEGDDIYYPVTARPASRRERMMYAQEMESHGDHHAD